MNRVEQWLEPVLERGGPTWWAWVMCLIGVAVGLTIGMACGRMSAQDALLEREVRTVVDDLNNRIAEVRHGTR